jgi:hypothetical protein
MKFESAELVTLSKCRKVNLWRPETVVWGQHLLPMATVFPLSSRPIDRWTCKHSSRLSISPAAGGSTHATPMHRLSSISPSVSTFQRLASGQQSITPKRASIQHPPPGDSDPSTSVRRLSMGHRFRTHFQKLKVIF